MPAAGSKNAGGRGRGTKAVGRSGARSGVGSPGYRFDIASNYDEAREVQQTILSECERHGFDENAHFALKLALEEALINAVKHGNKLDPKKRVRGRAEVSARTAVIEVQDEGPGFTRQAIPDPTLEENLEKTSGRGVLLIEAYMDEVEWTDHGRHIRMVKHNHPSGGED